MGHKESGLAGKKKETQEFFHFADRLNAAIKAKGSAVCVGLDPRMAQIPSYIKEKYFVKGKDKMVAAAESIIEFNKGIIDAVHDLVPIVKPQMAFFELYGSEGMRAFEETVRYAREKGLLTIADVKRGDIGSTAEAYAQAYLGEAGAGGLEVDAVTIAPYLGWDGVKPFVDEAKKHGKGVFVLVKTSNASSGDLQDLKIVAPKGTPAGAPENTIYEVMGHYVDSWGADELGDSGYSLVGAVVGATYPQQAAKLRQLMPNTIFLVPGYGAQGGTAQDVKACFHEDGLGAIVNSSRGIIFAWENSDTFTEKDFGEAARAATKAMIRDLGQVQ